MRSTNRYSFIRSLKRKGFKEEIVIKIGLYDLVTSTTLESNKSLAEMQSRPTEFLDFTSLTLDEFQQLVPPFEAAFQAHMAAWRLDGKPRTARQFAVYKNCPLPTPADRLFFILAYVKTYALQVVQGRLFGMGQSKANQWMAALAQRLGVSEATAATMVAPLAEEAAPGSATPDSPLVPMTGRNGASSAPKMLLNSKKVIVARKETTRSKMSC